MAGKMRKVLVAAALLLAAAAAFAAGKRTITGRIQIYGNAPHTFVGFVTTDGKQFSLDIDPAAKFSIQDITEHQGEQLKLTGVVNEKELIGFQTLRDGRFIVSKFKTTGKGSPKREQEIAPTN